MQVEMSKLKERKFFAMFHNCIFKVLSSLILLAVFCTNQVAAAPGNSANQAEKNVTPPISLISTTHALMPALDTGVLTCNSVAAGVTCTNHGSYLDYNINIVVTGLTGGATAYDIFIGSYIRSTNGGYMGMMSDFVHSETSKPARGKSKDTPKKYHLQH
jgi:hypothetical protein